jgi:hypothetical protein
LSIYHIVLHEESCFLKPSSGPQLPLGWLCAGPGQTLAKLNPQLAQLP